MTTGKHRREAKQMTEQERSELETREQDIILGFCRDYKNGKAANRVPTDSYEIGVWARLWDTISALPPRSITLNGRETTADATMNFCLAIWAMGWDESVDILKLAPTAIDTAKTCASIRDETIHTINTSDAKPIDGYLFPLDKVNSVLYNPSQCPIAIKQGKPIAVRVSGENKPPVAVTINFESLAEPLEAFDLRVVSICASVWNSGSYWTTIRGIAKQCFDTKKPSANQLERVRRSLIKLKATVVSIDNTVNYADAKSEADAFHRVQFRNVRSVLEIELKEVVVDGIPKVSGVFINAMPISVDYAMATNQITKVKDIRLPVNSTPRNEELFQYLLTRVKSKSGRHKVTWRRIYERVGVTTGQAGRLQETTKKIMDSFKKNGYIRSWRIDKTGEAGIAWTPYKKE